MPRVETCIAISQSNVRDVWETVCDFEKYPQVMADVLDIRFLERNEGVALSSWKVLLNGSELEWIERDRFTPLERIQFEQVEGDLEEFRGEWRFSESQSQVIVTLVVDFDLGIPSLAAILDPIGIAAIRANSKQMLASIHRMTVG